MFFDKSTLIARKRTRKCCGKVDADFGGIDEEGELAPS